MKRRTFLTGTVVMSLTGCLSLEETDGTQTEPTETDRPQSASTTATETTSSEPANETPSDWTAETMAPIEGAPVLGSETVYVHGGDYRVYAFDRATGDQQWVTEIGAPASLSSATAQPYLSDELVVTVTDSGVTALDRSDGGIRWSVNGGGGQLAASPITNGQTVVYSDQRTILRGVSLDAGEQQWQLSTSEWNLGGAVGPSGDDCIILSGAPDSTSCRMRTVAFSDGTEQLSTELSISNQLKLPHYVYVAEGVVVTDIDDGYVTGFDRETGDQLWQRSHASGVTPPVTVVNGTVYLKGSSGHEVGEMAVELQTGDLEWEITPTGSGSCCNVTPAVSQDLAYIANTGSTGLVGVDTTGEIRWRYNGSAVPTAQPAVDDNSMYIPADDGNLYHIALQQS